MVQLLLFEDRPQLTPNAIEGIFAERYRELRAARPFPAAHVEFYPFVGINHTIRLKDGTLYVRISDLFKEAPVEVISALAAILLCKLFRRRIPSAASSIYRDYTNSTEMKERASLVRKQRGRKLLLEPQGAYYDLQDLFARLNVEYFGGDLTSSHLGWSRKKSRRILGHFDPAHDSITISRILDDRRVPERVVSYVLYHEMLHAKLSISSHFDLKTRHSCQFKNEELKFRWYTEANDWLKTHL